MKKLFTLIAVAAMAFAAQADEWTAADGTAKGEFAPVYGYNFETEQHNQMQYPAAELTGMAEGTQITGIKFYTSTPNEVNALGGSVTISLANMGEATPWSVDGYGYISGDLFVIDVTTVATMTPAADENGVWTITFDAPFTYTGGTLLVDVQSGDDGNWQETEFYGKEMGAYYVMSVYGYAGSKKGQTILPKAVFTYEGGGEEPGITTLGQANALEDNAAFTFNGDAVVTYCLTGNNNIVYLFLRDESGYGMIANVDATFESGKVLSQGWNATKTSVNNGWVRFTNAENLNASNETNAELAAPQVLTAFPDESMLNAYVVIEKTTISSGGGGGFPGFPGHAVKYTLPDGSTIGETQTLWAFDGEAGDDLYNVYGIVCKVSGAFKIQPVKFEKYVEPQPEGLRGDVNDDKKVDIDDATMLINYLLGEPLEINQDNANCDLEGGVDIGDATALINYLLNSTW
jgi:hypothetical protein